ncbi:MAG: type II toxin-antitoxin system PemK/MazF family toxin [Pirellulaceae bacterium]
MTTSRGEIWLVNLDPAIGDEIKKTRPAVIVSSDAVGILALRVIAPITAWQDKFASCDWLVRVDRDKNNGLEKSSTVDTFQVRAVSVNRLVRRIGCLNPDDMNRVAEGLKSVLELD